MDFATARRAMVDSQVRCNDVTDLAIQEALETVPKEKFLPAGLRNGAYVEREIAYAPGRALPTARDFAKILAALKPRKSDLALEPASGCGYASAVLARLCEMVVAVENDASLAQAAQTAWTDLGIDNAAVVEGDPAAGAPKQGPFDIIYIGMAIERAPDALLAQLKDGGRLGAVLREGGVSKGCIWMRSGDVTAKRVVFDASARIIAPGFERPKSFAF